MEQWLHVSEAIAILAAASYGLYTFSDRKRQEAAKATETETSAAEKVTDAALLLLEPMKVRIESLENEVRELRLKVEQYIRDEVAYQAELHTKDLRIEELRAKLFEARDERDELNRRVEHLEDVCKRAGINGDE